MKKKGKNTLVFFMVFILFSSFGIAEKSNTPNQSLAELDELMKVKTIANCENAIKGYKKLLKKDPNNYKLIYKIAKANIVIVDIKTSAMIDEKNEYKPVLKKYGEIANDYAHKTYKINPKDKEVVAACLMAYGYYSSSFGIFKTIFKGAAGHYKDLANELIKLDDKHSGNLGYRSLGRLYHMAPWPVGSSKKALKYFHKSAAINKAVLESHYFLGFIYFDKNKYDLAKEEFTYMVKNPPWDDEAHYIEEYKKESQKYLEKIEKIQKKKKK
ncbi:tetratricopeptide repeat protein [Acidobacteriota bacterium]